MVEGKFFTAAVA